MVRFFDIFIEFVFHFIVLVLKYCTSDYLLLKKEFRTHVGRGCRYNISCSLRQLHCCETDFDVFSFPLSCSIVFVLIPSANLQIVILISVPSSSFLKSVRLSEYSMVAFRYSPNRYTIRFS